MTNGGQERSAPNMAQLFPRFQRSFKVYNAGMVMFTNKGMQLAREKFNRPFKEYRKIIISPCGLGDFTE